MVNRQKLEQLCISVEKRKSCAVISKTTNRCTNETKHLKMNIGDIRLNTACYRIHAYYYEHRVASADVVNCATDDYYRPYTNAVY